MFFSLFVFLLTTTGLLIATFTDFKNRIVPNKLNFSMLGIGLVAYGSYSFLTSSLWPLILSISGATLGFFTGFLLYKLGVWAGGDVKLLTAIGALNPVNPFIARALLPKIPAVFLPLNVPVFPITLFVFSLFAMLPVALLLSFKKILSRKELKKRLFEAIKKSLGFKTISVSLLAVGLNALLFQIEFHWILIIVLIGAVSLVKWKKLKLLISCIVFIFALINSPLNALSEFILLYASLVFLWNMFSVMSLSREALKTKKKVQELKEGMIPAETIVMEKGKALRKEPLTMKRIINYIKHYRLSELSKELQPCNTEIISSRKARGLTAEEIKKLKRLVREGKLKNWLYVKESAPMVPAILIAYIALNLVGDILWNLVL